MKTRVIMLISLIGSFLVAQSAQCEVSFRGTGDLPGRGIGSFSMDVSADGSTVVGRSYSSYGVEGFYLKGTGDPVGIGGLEKDPSGYYSTHCWAVSADGSTIVGQSYTTNGPGPASVAFRWTLLDGMISLGDLPGGIVRSAAWGISDDGSVIIGNGRVSDVNYDDRAFRWTQDGGMISLGLMGDNPAYHDNSNASAISGDGSTIVGTCAYQNLYYGFRWTESEGMVDMGTMNGEAMTPNGISKDGSVIVGSIGYGFARWTQSIGIVGLGKFPGHESAGAQDVSENGEVIIGISRDMDGNNHACVWDPLNGMRKLADILTAGGVDLTGWALEEAYGVSDDGTVITGIGTNPSGYNEGFVAVIPLVVGTRGTPIEWLEALGYTTDFHLMAFEDLDADGFLNWQEYQADTNPTNILSFLTNSISSRTGLAIEWFSSSNRVYGISYCDDLAAGIWNSLTNGIIGSGGLMSVPVTNTAPRRCYRVNARKIP